MWRDLTGNTMVIDQFFAFHHHGSAIQYSHLSPEPINRFGRLLGLSCSRTPPAALLWIPRLLRVMCCRPFLTFSTGSYHVSGVGWTLL